MRPKKINKERIGLGMDQADVRIRLFVDDLNMGQAVGHTTCNN